MSKCVQDSGTVLGAVVQQWKTFSTSVSLTTWLEKYKRRTAASRPGRSEKLLSQRVGMSVGTAMRNMADGCSSEGPLMKDGRYS